MSDRKEPKKINIELEDLDKEKYDGIKKKIDVDLTSNNREANNISPGRTEPNYRGYNGRLASDNIPRTSSRQGGQVEYPKADYGKRILASLIDLAIAYLPGTIYSLIIFPIAFSGALRGQAFVFISLLSFGQVLIWGLGAIYFFIKDGLGLGQSIGKKMQQLMVVRLEDNRPCTMGTSFIRSFILYFLLPIEIIISLAFNDKGHRLGDMAVKTQVIDSEIYR